MLLDELSEEVEVDVDCVGELLEVLVLKPDVVPALDVGVTTLLLRVRDHTSLEPRDEVSVDDPAVVVTLALKLSLALGPDSGGVGVAVGGPNFLIK